jgi:hypothetical protein
MAAKEGETEISERETKLLERGDENRRQGEIKIRR